MTQQITYHPAEIMPRYSHTAEMGGFKATTNQSGVSDLISQLESADRNLGISGGRAAVADGS